MGKILRFPGKRRHERAPAGSGVASSASASKVISEQPFSPANRTISAQRRGGMPRTRQELIVLGGKPSAAETAPVPPRASIAESAVSIMDPNIVRTLRTCQAFADCEATFSEDIETIAAMADTLTKQAKRLEATRIACGAETQKEFYKAVGLKKSSWSDFENGERALTLAAARKIKARYKIPLDWSLDGDKQALDLAPARIRDNLMDFAA